jgi:hypothetical protein
MGQVWIEKGPMYLGLGEVVWVGLGDTQSHFV